ncbi:MAG: coproporphyrinogen III oxidase [Rhizobiales bacterium]|nr:coproporphyrinogen III oxidase [Hyphomicrobiales bacterium]
MKRPEPGFGIYLHWPFCESKCPYCDFNSHVRHGGVAQADYVEAYRREIDYFAGLTQGQTVTSIFFGGGTPSLMAPETLDALIRAVRDTWEMAPGAEITMEANPSSVEAERFEAYRASGVNRLSLGVQSLHDADLRFLGRLHNVEQALSAVEIARATFPRISFDLIYARPGQTENDWEDELNLAIDHAADHLSLYQLTIEPETPFQKLFDAGKLIPPDPDHARRLYDITQHVCEARGLPAYEISNHARPGSESRHNLTYWRYGDYAGIGPGAHSRLTLEGERTAMAVEPFPETWLREVSEKGHGIWQVEVLSEEQSGDEMLLMGLRLKEGISISRYEALSGRKLDERQIESLIRDGMLEKLSDDVLRVSREGWFVLDAVVADLAA